MTPELIMIVLLVIALSITIVGWANEYAKKEAFRAIAFQVTDGKVGNNLVKVEPSAPPPIPPEKPKGPRFEWDDDDGCWVLKECVRVDGGTIFYNVPPYYWYYNITAKKCKSTHEAKNETT